MHVGEDQLPPEWARPGLHPVTQAIGDRWIDFDWSAVLQVPSAMVRGETNFIVNPRQADSDALTTGPISPFRYDPRLAQ
jgi:RES domain-containing protein